MAPSSKAVRWKEMPGLTGVRAGHIAMAFNSRTTQDHDINAVGVAFYQAEVIVGG